MPNKENNKQKALYDALTKDGYDLGTFDSFSKNVGDEAKRKALYETITKDNWDVGDYDSFSNNLVGSASSQVQMSNPLEQPLHVEVPESIRSSNGLNGSNPSPSGYELPSDFAPKSEDDKVFEENMRRFKNGEPIVKVSKQQMIDAHPELGLEGKDNGYQPTEEEVKARILNNKPGMFVNQTSSLMDKPLGSAAGDPELYGEKFDARVDSAKRYYGSDEFKNRVKKETGDRVMDLVSKTDEDLKSIDEQIESRTKAIRNDDWRPGMPSVHDDHTLADLRGQRAMLNSANDLLDDSRKIVEEAGKKDSSWFTALGRGVRDKVFDVDSWTMGITDMAGSMNLNKVLEKADKDESLTPAEQRLLDAAVTNMAVNAYYSSDLSASYKAGQVTGESIPFMLEMAVNPISASGNATAKLLLKYGLKKFGQQMGRNVGKTIGAAAGMTATTGVPGVIGGAYDRMNGQVTFGLDDKGQLTYAGRKGAMSGGEAFAKSAASRFLENHSEMVFNAFKGMGDVVWRGVQKVVPDGVNGFIQKAANTGAGKLVREFGNNELMKEVAKRTQFHGIAGEYLEEVYNNLANVPLGEMTMEQVTDLDQNIDTFLGLAPTSVFFGLLGLGSMTAERIQHRRKMDAAFGSMTDVQRKKFAELERLSKENGNTDIRVFIKETMADPNLTKEQKRQEIEYAYDIAVNNAFDEVAEEQTVEQGEARVASQEEGSAVYASGNPAAIRESAVREDVSRSRLEEVFPDVETIARLAESDDAGRAEILDEMPEDVRDRAKAFLADYDRVQAVEDSINEAHVPEVEAAESRVSEMVRHGHVTVISLGRFGDGSHSHGVIVNGLDENGNTTVSGDLVMVVPLLNGESGPDFSSFDTMKAEALAIDPTMDRQELAPDAVVEAMLGSYQSDVEALRQDAITPGQSFVMVDSKGQPHNAQIQGQDAQGNWVVAFEDQKNPSVMLEENLRELLLDAKRAPIVAEYEAKEMSKKEAREAAKREVVSDSYSPEVMALQPEPGEELEVNGRRASVVGVTPDGINVRYLTEKGMTSGADVIPMEDYYAYKQSLFDSSQQVQPKVQEAEVEDSKNQAELATIPVKDDGSTDFVAYGRENTFRSLGERYGEKLPHKVEVTAKAYASDLAKMQKKLDKAQTDYDDAPIGREGKAEEALNKVRQEYDALKREADFWLGLDAEIKEAQANREAILTPQAETDTSNEPMTADEFVAQQLAAGNIVLNKENYKSETGFGDEEANSLNGGAKKLFGKDGMTIQEAGERLMEMDRENGAHFFDQDDSNAGRDALISVLSSVKNRKNLNSYIANNRAEQAKRDSEGLRNELEKQVIDAHYSSLEDYVLQMEAVEMENLFLNDRLDEIMAIFAEEAAKYEQFLNITENGQGTENEVVEGSDSVLLEEQPDDTGGIERFKNERDSERVGERPSQESEGTHASNETVSQIEKARAEVALTPTEAQKEAGNYKKGHVRIDGYDITIENPKGGVRSGRDKNGKEWSVTMNNDYGYIRGTEAVDGDHIDVFLSDDPSTGNVFVVDQMNEDGTFDESKVMYGFSSMDEARAAYLSNYEEGWEGRIMAITEVSKEDFKKWIDSSHRKTKAFSEYKSVSRPWGDKEESRRKPLRERAREWGKALGVDVVVLESIDEVTDVDTRREIQAAHAEGAAVPGWINRDGTVYFFMPDIADVKDVDDTYIHEVVAHKGLPSLLGKERFAELCDKVWDMMPQSAKDEFMNYPGVNGNTRIAADEYIAHLAEKQNLTPEEKTVWDKILKFFRDALDKALNGMLGKAQLTDKDLAELIRISYANLKQGAAQSESDTTRFLAKKRKEQLLKAERFIEASLKGQRKGKSFHIQLPLRVENKIKSIIGRSFDSHSLHANSFVHAKNNHGVGGRKVGSKDIPLRDEDFKLAPYIMVAPDMIERGSSDSVNAESIKFEKKLSNGLIIVVEKEQEKSPNDVETTTMWAKKSSDVYDARNKRPHNSTSETVIISSDDAAKIRKDAELAIEEDVKRRTGRNFRRVFHGSAANFDKFDRNFSGSGEGQAVMGAGHYVTTSEGTGRYYAEVSSEMKRKVIQEGGYTYNGEVVRSRSLVDAYEALKKNEFDVDKAIESIEHRIAVVRRVKGDKANTTNAEEALKLLNEEKLSNGTLGYQEEVVEKPARYLYEVEIPDDNGKNYFDLDKKATKKTKDEAKKRLYSALGKSEESEYWEKNRDIVEDEWRYNVNTSEATNDSVRATMEQFLTQEEVADILSAMGYVGSKSKASEGTTYIIYKDEDLEIKNKTRFRFIGEKGARNLDKAEEATTRLDNLAVAREMESAKKDAKTIKMATGWERGADGLWRYEVNDNIDFDLRRPKKVELKKAYDEANEKYYKLEMRVPVRTPKNATEEERQRIKDMRKELAKLRKAMNKAFDAYYDYSAESATLGEFLGKDNQLFKEYPKLADYDVSFLRDSKKLAEGLKGSFTPEYKVIWVDDERPKGDIKSTLVHEIQHAIQDIEGFAQGGTPAAFASAKYQAEDWKKTFNDFINRYGFEDWSKNLPIEDWMKYGKAYKGQFGGLHRAFIDNAVEDEDIKKSLIKELDYVKAAYDKFYQVAGGMDAAYKFKDANEWYRSLSGEVESRNVQQRMGMTDEQRRNTLAESTEDVAREDQIFLRDGIESGETRLRFVREPAIDYVSQANDVVEVPKDEVMYTMNNIAPQLYKTSGRFMRELYKYGTLGRVLKGEYAEIDQIKAKNEYDHAKPIFDEYLNELVWMKYQSTEAAQEVINKVISDVEYAMQYYKDLSLGKDVWRTHNSPRFRITEEKRKAINKAVSGFTSKYKSKPVVILEIGMGDNELMDALDNKFKLEDIKSVIKDRKSIASYDRTIDKVIIFADRMSPDKVQKALLHENIHAATHHHNFSNLKAYFYEYAKDEPLFEKWYKLANNKNYQPYDASEEFLAYVVSNAMMDGNLDVVAKYLGEEQKEALNKLFNEIGYDYDIRRRSSEQSNEQGGTGSTSKESVLDVDGQSDSGKADGRRKGIRESEGRTLSPTERKERLIELFGKVADMGLEGVLGNESYNVLMRDVYNSLPKDVRSQIKEDAVLHYNGDFVPAMSDYLNVKGKANVWDKIVGAFKDALHRIGIDVSLTENDVKYLLWRNQKRLNPYSIIDKAADIHKLATLKVGAYSDEASPTRFREKRPAIVQRYDKVIDSSSFRFQEAFQDSMLSLKVLMEAIEAESGKKAKSFENAYTAENRLSSINKIDNEKYLADFFNPLMAEIKSLSDKFGQKTVEDYIYAKSGLERNEVLKQRDADKAYALSMEELDEMLRKGELTDDQYDALKTNAEIARTEAMAKEEDYAGLRGLLFNSKVYELDMKLERGEIDLSEYNALYDKLKEDAEEVEKGFKEYAEGLVSDFETEAGEDAVNGLWEKINAATNETLRKDYESGMMDKETYEATKNMMKYYVPLRGWSEETADEVYDYYHKPHAIQRNQKAAKGRRSQADNPITSIAQMAQNAIVRGNRNKMKQRLFNFVVNRPTSLATFHEGWYVKNNATGDFELEYPRIEEGDTAEDIQRKMDEFEKRMERLSKDKEAFKGKMPFGSPYRIQPKQQKEHLIPVMINGREYGIYVNGNPRAAQAVNGLTNPEASNILSEMYESAKRFYSAGLTSWNPDFLMANAVRDSIHSVTMTYLDKGPLVAAHFLRDIPKSLQVIRAEIFGKGSSDPQMHQYFEEFVNFGGETGYTAIQTLEDYKKEYEKILKNLEGWEKSFQSVKYGFSAIAGWMEQANRMFEDISRFNAYQAARKSGLGIEESVDAAKNITVNFNKKGAMGTTKGIWGSIAGVMSKWILFFNPTVQGITQILRSKKANPKRFNALMGAVFGSGLIVPMLNSLVVGMLGGDEEDYWLQNDYNRMNNLLLKNPLGSGYVKIPLPPTFREIYGMGDILYRLLTGRITPERAAVATLRQMQLLTGFLNVIPDDEPDLGKALIGLAPDVLAPLTDVVMNQDFTGRKIAKVSDYNKHDPEYLRVYKGVSPFYVEMSRYINKMGGDDISRAPLYGTFINPAYMEHIVTGYTGGIGKTLSNVAGIVADAVSGEFNENFDMRKVPIASRFYSVSDEATVRSAVNRKYRDYQSRYEKLNHDYKKYKDAVNDGKVQYSVELERMENSGEKAFVEYFKRKQKVLNKKLDRLKKDPDNKDLEKEITDLKAEIALKCYELLK